MMPARACYGEHQGGGRNQQCIIVQGAARGQWLTVGTCRQAAPLTLFQPCGLLPAPRTYVILPRGIVQRNVLADEYSDANAAEVEAVQKLVDLRQLIQAQLRTNTLLVDGRA